MIKFLPRIYPDESVHSFLCRLYVHSGYVWHIGFANEIFAKGHEVPEYNFINTFNGAFRRTLEGSISYKTLLLEHTLFPYYARFLPKDRRSQAYDYAMSNKPYLHKYLSIPPKKQEHYLCYCPKCVETDRALYGECYFHVSHQIPATHICPIHNCKLVDTPIPNTKTKNTILAPLEHVISACGEVKAIEYEPDNTLVKVAKYIYDTLHQPLLLESEIPIGDFLTVKLQDKYLSPRGEQRHLAELYADMSVYYQNLRDYDISNLSFLP